MGTKLGVHIAHLVPPHLWDPLLPYHADRRRGPVAGEEESEHDRVGDDDQKREAGLSALARDRHHEGYQGVEA